MQRLLLALALAASVTAAHARDQGQWDDVDPQMRLWFQGLRQPDNPTASCCGEADAYWADKIETGPNGELIAVVTDTRPDEWTLADGRKVYRPHIAPGTRIVVPKNKYKWDEGNPTSHNVLFISGGGMVYCFVALGGV